MEKCFIIRIFRNAIDSIRYDLRKITNMNYLRSANVIKLQLKFMRTDFHENMRNITVPTLVYQLKLQYLARVRRTEYYAFSI